MKKKATEQDSAVYAAIGLALHEMAEEVHDVEANIITIKHEFFGYSPWSSKALGMRQPLNVKKHS
jgi:hypothetical protein